MHQVLEAEMTQDQKIFENNKKIAANQKGKRVVNKKCKRLAVYTADIPGKMADTVFPIPQPSTGIRKETVLTDF